METIVWIASSLSAALANSADLSHSHETTGYQLCWKGEVELLMKGTRGQRSGLDIRAGAPGWWEAASVFMQWLLSPRQHCLELRDLK